MRRRFTREERTAILDKFAQSGMTQQAFASSEGLNLGTFRGWLYRSRNQDKVEHAEDLRFVELKLPLPLSSPGRVTLLIGDALRLELNELPPVDYLFSLVEALDRC